VPGTRAAPSERCVGGHPHLKSSSEVPFPVSSTSRIVHVGFVALAGMVEAESVSTHGLKTHRSPISRDACAATSCLRDSD
jgi:hypothetical protein